jgi:glutamate formiminotransferase
VRKKSSFRRGGSAFSGTQEALTNEPPLGTLLIHDVPIATANKNNFVLVDVTRAVKDWLNGTLTNSWYIRYMQTIVECVPNFSEGRDRQKVNAIIQALLAGPDVYLLDKEMDADHNRSVITLVGTREEIGEAALRGIGKAAELIDLTHHQGAHPRLGATDVVPFVPIAEVTLDDCISIAQWTAEQAWRRFKIPTFLYEAAARKPERRNLENIRRGQFEGLRDEVRTNPERRPDFGEAELHPTAGATVVGARKFLIAFNINLNTADVSLAKAIAKKIRASSGGLPCVKAMGVSLTARNLAQVSMNLTDFETTSLGTVYDAVTREAAAAGVTAAGSEIIGLIPRRALEDAAVHYLKVEGYHPDLIVENRLARVLSEKSEVRSQESEARTPVAVPTSEVRSLSSAPLHTLTKGFVEAVAASTPTPGGGSVSALAGALAAALGEMVCDLSLGKKSVAAHHVQVKDALGRLTELRNQLELQVDHDAASYDAVVAALRKPKATEAEQAERARAIEEASKSAALVPLATAEMAFDVRRRVQELLGVTFAGAASDLAVALGMSEAAIKGAVVNVRANLPLIHDAKWVTEIEAKVQALASLSANWAIIPPVILTPHT